ncbi:Smr/MutS family protein [Thioalkalivibrio sp. ALJT]|uniref:Smr/MutS family protein n=1 Tax=Thioalkalivibrio sp. ALJT TaxID=1158146 RepID=UPI00037BE73C|nr:Smr/MutS family protein [Thioalkalivibrio sp. ALJT]
MSRLSIDLHECFRNGRRIDAELNGAIEQACARRIKTVEIIHGKGSGQLKKRVLRFLQQPEIKACYHRVEKDSKNHGRLFVHFRH